MGNTNVLLDGKAQEIMKDVYNLGGGEGKQLYQHNITLTDEPENPSYTFTLVIINSSNEELTYSDILDYLRPNFKGTYDEATQKYIGNVYTLGVAGGLGGGTGAGLDCCFILDINEVEVLCFEEVGSTGVYDYMDSTPNANVRDIVLPL